MESEAEAEDPQRVPLKAEKGSSDLAKLRASEEEPGTKKSNTDEAKPGRAVLRASGGRPVMARSEGGINEATRVMRELPPRDPCERGPSRTRRGPNAKDPRQAEQVLASQETAKAKATRAARNPEPKATAQHVPRP